MVGKCQNRGRWALGSGRVKTLLQIVGAVFLGGLVVGFFMRGATPVLVDDFETLGNSDLAAQLLPHDHLSLALGAGTGSSVALRARYVGGPMGSERMVVNVPLPASYVECTLNYDVRFARGFDFARGGKLHGLGPAQKVTGGRPIRPDGWSARVMFGEGGTAKTYTYHQDQQGKYGEGGTPARSFRFEPGQYYAVSLHVRVNDLGSEANDGFTRLYVDGQLVEARENVRFRGVGGEETAISQFLFSTFHGGHTPEWAPRDPKGDYATDYAYFDNIAIHSGEHIRAKPGS